MTKYCGYEIGRGKGKITPEQVERLFKFLHANFSHMELIMLSQEDLNEIARESKREWW